MFELHPLLKADSYDIGYFPLCRLLLARDAGYPWFILVPQVVDISEIYQLSLRDQTQYLQESSLLAEYLKKRFQADKLNIATLGNVVPQLHIHHIVRYTSDPSWPAPVWDTVPTTAYTEHSLKAVLKTLDRGRLPDFKFNRNEQLSC